MSTVRVKLRRTEIVTVDVECDYATIKLMDLQRLAAQQADRGAPRSHREYSIIEVNPGPGGIWLDVDVKKIEDR